MYTLDVCFHSALPCAGPAALGVGKAQRAAAGSLRAGRLGSRLAGGGATVPSWNAGPSPPPRIPVGSLPPRLPAPPRLLGGAGAHALPSSGRTELRSSGMKLSAVRSS